MAHGNWSDMMALFMFALGVVSLGWPRTLSQQIVPPLLVRSLKRFSLSFFVSFLPHACVYACVLFVFSRVP